MRKALAATLALSWICLGTACSDSGNSAAEESSGDVKSGWDHRTSALRSSLPSAGGVPALGRIDDLDAPADDRKLDFTFPDTLCGNLVQRLLECEIERIRNQPRMQENEKKSVISNKRRTFARKRNQYLSHCQGKVAGLPESGVRSCLPLPCVEMDRCLQKISGQTGPK